MNERERYAAVRQKIIDAMKMDLLGPSEENEILNENPRYAYLVGILAPQEEPGSEGVGASEQEADMDLPCDEDDTYSAGEDDDNEPVSTGRFHLPSTLGISFYLESSLPGFMIDVTWGEYLQEKQESEQIEAEKKGRKNGKILYQRVPQKETLYIDCQQMGRSLEFGLQEDSNVRVYVSRIRLKDGYCLYTVHVTNRRPAGANDIDSLMFQTNIRVYSENQKPVFIAEHICREVLAPDEYYFEQRPIFGRGRGCAATWGGVTQGRASYVESDYIPQYEFPGVSASLDGFDQFYFSMRYMAVPGKKDGTFEKLNTLADTYEEWIERKLVSDPKMGNGEFRSKVGDNVVSKCRAALDRIREGIELLKHDEIAYDAFCFMNRVMVLQRNIMNYSKKYGAGIECRFRDFVDPRNPKNDFGWRPFQIAFILMNLNAMVDPEHRDREIVDLLYFPTGGGKTEAYLGLMAFTIANRRLRADDKAEYNSDGGVTIILRYTLRLLTTQQRDRITKMVLAAEMVRKREEPKYGMEPISIGFWVGGGVTPNKFDEINTDTGDPEKNDKARTKRKLLYKQLPKCPFCGKPLTEDDFYIDVEQKSVKIFCSDNTCFFYKYRQNNKMCFPVYLVDEEIYAKCPTIILSTVDKFARLPWDPSTNALFGRVDRKCSRDGYVALGAPHTKHKRTVNLPASTLTPVRPFLPPELIIQDELHLITGPLGTIYGAYETIIEDLCTWKKGEKRILPKYVVSTATIKNAEDQAKCLYARKRTSQFPPNGFEIGDSFFIREIPTDKDPFRKYVGICASGQSVKTALLRTYAILLQEAFALSQDPEYKDYIDPYYTLIGYYNSIRELGGAVRLLQDDIPKRIERIQKKYDMPKQRYLSRRAEITSRTPSYEIPKRLNQLEIRYDSRECLDTAIATNMIAVGMDVDRLGLMVVTGQPKQNSEYIQATSRIGRSFPGLVVTVYNPYRPRDLSHYENFTGYHSQLYRFVEGTTATPFSARARDRVLHALIIAAIRLKYPEFAPNTEAARIGALTEEQLQEVKTVILDRMKIIKPDARQDAEGEIDKFIDAWKSLVNSDPQLHYYVYATNRYNRLMNGYGELCKDTELPTLRSMREVEKSANMYYYTEE